MGGQNMWSLAHPRRALPFARLEMGRKPVEGPEQRDRCDLCSRWLLGGAQAKSSQKQGTSYHKNPGEKGRRQWGGERDSNYRHVSDGMGSPASSLFAEFLQPSARHTRGALWRLWRGHRSPWPSQALRAGDPPVCSRLGC